MSQQSELRLGWRLLALLLEAPQGLTCDRARLILGLTKPRFELACVAMVLLVGQLSYKGWAPGLKHSSMPIRYQPKDLIWASGAVDYAAVSAWLGVCDV